MSTSTQAPVNVLVTRPLGSEFLAAVRAVDPRVHLAQHVGEVPPEVLREAEVLYTGELFPGRDVAPALRWVQLDTSGADHLPSTDLWARDCAITTLGGISPAPLAEWVLMMVLAHAHRLPLAMRLQQQRRWPPREERWKEFMPRNLRTSTLGIVGYGRIGRELARMAVALGMKVIATRRQLSATDTDPKFRRVIDVPGVEVLPAEAIGELVAASDYVALTVPLTPQTRGLIGEAELRRAKPGVVIVNGSRGGVIDEDALLSALDAGVVELVASDVFADEPLPPTSPWWGREDVVITPHVAGFAPDYEESVTALFTENLRRYLAGEPLLNVANREWGY